MSARGSGAFEVFVLRSTGRGMLAGCAVPAIVVCDPPRRRVLLKVLIAADGSESSLRAVRALLKFRRLPDPEPRVTLVVVQGGDPASVTLLPRPDPGPPTGRDATPPGPAA